MSIASNLSFFWNELKPFGAQLVAVSKTKPTQAIIEAYEAGQRAFGENHVQELVAKYHELPQDIEWHLIGHLQSNKVKHIASFVSLIHSVDSFKLLQTIHKEALKHGRVIDCLLQIYIAQEETKFGLSTDEALDLVQNPELAQLTSVRIVGLMGIATNTDNEAQIEGEFKTLKSFFELLKMKVELPNVDMRELSMGMSHDYQLALAQGATLIRVGSALFGERLYL